MNKGLCKHSLKAMLTTLPNPIIIIIKSKFTLIFSGKDGCARIYQHFHQEQNDLIRREIMMFEI